MNEKEIIYFQAKLIAELKQQLDAAKDTADIWYKEAQRRIPVQPLTMEETVHALANAEIPRAEDF